MVFQLVNGPNLERENQTNGHSSETPDQVKIRTKNVSCYVNRSVVDKQTGK